jgi:hypothetical protein
MRENVIFGLLSRGLFLFSCICWGLLCALRYNLFWRKFQGQLRRMYIVVLLDKIFYRCQMSFWPMVSFRSRISLLIFCLDDLSMCDRGVIKSPNTTVLESICACKSFRECLMKLGAYRLIIVISFWCIAPFIYLFIYY